MFCPKCGDRNSEEGGSCGRCGAPAAAGAPRAAAVSKKMKIGIGIATVVIPVVGIVMGFIYMRDENKEKREAGRIWLWAGVAMGVLYLMSALQ